jgi:glycosyltransferase involved in cell wall biosynthesis
MVHDHSLYCLRAYKYNYFTRRICTRAASPYCVFPCLAPLARNHGEGFPLRWASYLEKRKEIALHRRCQALIVYSDYSKQELVRNGFAAERISTCVPMRSPGAEGHSTFSDRNLLLFAGQLIRGKGVDALLRALAKVRTPFECNILGDGNHRHYCEALSRRLGLSERVHFLGYVLPAELRRFYLEASMFVMSSLWPEPFGMAGPEAMRYGLPVIAFDAGGIAEWLRDGHNGFLVPWNDLDRYAERVERLLDDKHLARLLGQRGRQWVQRYEVSSQIDPLERLFQRLALNPERGPDELSLAAANPVCL